MKKIVTYAFVLILGLLFTATSFLCFSASEDIGNDHTKEFAIYSDLSNLTSLKDVKVYLDDNKLSYEIEDGKLSLTEYKNVMFIINSDNVNGNIKSDKDMEKFILLNNPNYEEVSVKTIYSEDGVTEQLYIDGSFARYSKIGDNYYINPTFLSKLFSRILISLATFCFVVVIISLFINIVCFIKNKTNN